MGTSADLIELENFVIKTRWKTQNVWTLPRSDSGEATPKITWRNGFDAECKRTFISRELSGPVIHHAGLEDCGVLSKGKEVFNGRNHKSRGMGRALLESTKNTS